MPTNYETAFEARPDVYEAWLRLGAAIKSTMDFRRFELVTFAAAQRLRSTYCSVAHGRVLRDTLGEDVLRIARDRREAGLSEVDVAVMDFAEKVVDDASAITEDDRQVLRRLGLTDTDILDVTLAAALRCFFSKTLDGVGVLADASYGELDPALLDVLVVGRPIASE
jgi:alkylhydroperoxidase family enzyme